MTHNEKRRSAVREGQLALFTGGIFGATHTISGHPLDTIKSKMQIQAGYSDMGSIAVARKIFKHEGFIGFFKGCIPPLWGSVLYRGVMMSSYEFAFTWIDKNCPKDGVLNSESVVCIRPIVPVAALFSSACRSIIESPIEYAKVMGQTNKQWVMRDIYRGVEWQILRTTGLLIPIFSIVDIFRQKTDVLKSFTGNFLVTAGASGLSYLICWPLETMKNLAQSGTPHPGATFAERIAFLGGPIGIYRGVWPGTLCGAVRNGCAMVAMVQAQKWATQLGMRD